METIILKSHSKSDIKLIAEIAKKIGVSIVEKTSEPTIMEEIEEGLKEVKLMKEGKLPQKKLEDLLDGK